MKPLGPLAGYTLNDQIGREPIPKQLGNTCILIVTDNHRQNLNHKYKMIGSIPYPVKATISNPYIY